MTIYTHLFATPFGTMLSAVDESGALMLLTFCPNTEAAHVQLAQEFKKTEIEWDSVRSANVVQEMEEYFKGERQTFSLPLNPIGTEYEKRVWEALINLPYGSTTTYGQLAAQLGNPKASRAVGRANAMNPIAVVVPCHRVIGSSGKLTGYAYGLSVKERLLEMERSYR